MRNIEFHEEADLELTHTFNWYEKKKEGLGTEFYQAVKASLALIINSPETWPKYFEKYSKLNLSRFPYAITYKFDEETIIVMGVISLSREPGYWLDRDKS